MARGGEEPPPGVERDIEMSHVTGAEVDSMDYAIHHLALRANMLPWELEALDPPADVFFRAIAIESADARGRRKARQREAEQRQRGQARRR